MSNPLISMLSREDLLLLYPVGRIIESAVAIPNSTFSTIFPGTEWKELKDITFTKSSVTYSGKDCFTATADDTYTEPTIDTDGKLVENTLTFAGDNNGIATHYHEKGSMRIKGKFGQFLHADGGTMFQVEAPFSVSVYQRGSAWGGGGGGYCFCTFDTNLGGWTGSTTNAVDNSPTPKTIGKVNGNMPKYLAVHKYIRVK